MADEQHEESSGHRIIEKQGISNIVLGILYENKLEEYKKRLEELRDPHIIYVTDLVYCPLKRLFRIKYPELTFTFDPHFIVGEMIHRGLQTILLEKGFEIEKEVEQTVVIEGEEYRVKGRIDAYSPDLLVEIKTGRSGMSIPHEHHLLQLRIYLAMTGVRKGVLVYITSDRASEYIVERDPNLTLETLVEKHLKRERVPMWDWECRICHFNRLCPYKTTS